MMEKLTKKSMRSALMKILEIIAVLCKHSLASELSVAGWNSEKSDYSCGLIPVLMTILMLTSIFPPVR